MLTFKNTLIALLICFTAFSTSLNLTSNAEDPIYEDVSTAVSPLTSIIKTSKIKLIPNGTDKTDITFSLINALGDQVTRDFYTVAISSSNGKLTPIAKDAAGIYSSQFTTPKSGIDSKIDVTITYKYYACDGVEDAIANLDEEYQQFYRDSGFSFVNSKIIQLTRGISDIDMEEIVYDQGQDVAGLEDWTSDDREGFTDDFYAALIQLKCYKPGESSTLTQKVFSYVDAPVVVTPAPTPVPPSTPKIEPAFKPYTTRTGGLKNGFIFVSLLTFGLTFAIIIKNKVTKK